MYTVLTTSQNPACYMYTYTGLLTANSTTSTRSKDGRASLWNDLFMPFEKSLTLVAQSLLNLVFGIPLVRHKWRKRKRKKLEQSSGTISWNNQFLPPPSHLPLSPTSTKRTILLLPLTSSFTTSHSRCTLDIYHYWQVLEWTLYHVSFVNQSRCQLVSLWFLFSVSCYFFLKINTQKASSLFILSIRIGIHSNRNPFESESIRAGNFTGLHCGFVSYLGVAVWVEVRVWLVSSLY